MCFCTPEIRTPWCGRVGCEQPGQERRSLNARIAELEAERDSLDGQAKDALVEIRNRNEEIATLTAQVERLKEAQALVAQQAEDAGLWFNAQYITEAGLQEALRQLHAVIEGKSPDECARTALSDNEGKDT